MFFRNRSVVVSRFIRKLPGGSQPVLVEAADGELYVLKFLNNMQGKNLLFNESIGTELYHLAKLPVPRWRPLVLTPAFVDQNSSCYIETPDGRCKPLPGMCFGSLFLGARNRQTYEILPGTFYKRLTNAEDFWLAWLLDVCANHADHRQALFPAGLGGSFYAMFIDHGHMFGGPNAAMRPHIVASRYLDPRIYGRVDAEQATRLKNLAVNLRADRLWLEANNLPQEWKSASALHQLSECLSSLACSAIIENMLDALLELHRSMEDTHRNCGGLYSRKPPVSILCSGPRASRLGGLHVV